MLFLTHGGVTTTTFIDPETGLYYYRARYYNPRIGRFLNEDPIGYLGGINLYTHVNNNPVNWIDPWGLCGKEEGIGITLLDMLLGVEPAYAGENIEGVTVRSIGHGIIDEALIVGGVGLMAGGVYLANPVLVKVGAGLTVIGVIGKIREVIEIPKTAEKIIKRSGIEEFNKDIEELLKEVREP